MGLLNFVGKTLGFVKGTKTKGNKRSAINRGRMHKTDQIKGSKSKIPPEPGVYRHVDKATGKNIYTGQTNNLRKRQQEHARKGKLNTSKHDVHWSSAKKLATKDDLCATEKAHIKRNKPINNKTRGGNGRR